MEAIFEASDFENCCHDIARGIEDQFMTSLGQRSAAPSTRRYRTEGKVTQVNMSIFVSALWTKLLRI